MITVIRLTYISICVFVLAYYFIHRNSSGYSRAGSRRGSGCGEPRNSRSSRCSTPKLQGRDSVKTNVSLNFNSNWCTYVRA